MARAGVVFDTWKMAGVVGVDMTAEREGEDVAEGEEVLPERVDVCERVVRDA